MDPGFNLVVLPRLLSLAEIFSGKTLAKVGEIGLECSAFVRDPFALSPGGKNTLEILRRPRWVGQSLSASGDLGCTLLTKMAHDVFISYAQEDKAIADAVCNALEAEGIACWYAPRDVPYGQDFEEAIVDAIGISRLLILILSSHSNSSAHVKREVQNACSEEVKVPVLPFRVEDVPLNKALRYYIASVHWLDAVAPPIELHLQRLLDHVQARVPRSLVAGQAETAQNEATSDFISAILPDETAGQFAVEEDVQDKRVADSQTQPEAESQLLRENEAVSEPPVAKAAGPQLKHLLALSGVLLVLAMGVVPVVVIFGIIMSKSRETAKATPSPTATVPMNQNTNGNFKANNSVPANNSVVSNNLNPGPSSGSLNNVPILVFHSAGRTADANRIAERLRRLGAHVTLYEREVYGFFAGHVYYHGTRAADSMKIVNAVSDIERLISEPAKSGAETEFYIWLGDKP